MGQRVVASQLPPFRCIPTPTFLRKQLEDNISQATIGLRFSPAVVGVILQINTIEQAPTL